MAAKPKEYQRLPGQGIRRDGFFSVSVTARRVRLWLGRDHLLSVESHWYTEEYRRFYFRDIQAVIFRKTNSGKIINLVLGFLLLLTLWWAIVTTGGFQVFWIIIGSVAAFFLLLNTLYGPTCVCHLRTAVQTEEMPTLRRLRRARKVMKRVRPLIAAAQGELAPVEIHARVAQPSTVPPAAGTETSAPASAPQTATPPAEPPLA